MRQQLSNGSSHCSRARHECGLTRLSSLCRLCSRSVLFVSSLCLVSHTSAAYQTLSEARGWAKEYQYLRVRLKTEQCRLLDWAHVAQLTEREETLLISKASRSVLVDVLDQQRRLLLKFGRLDERFQPLAEPLICEEADEQKSRGTDIFESRFPDAGTILKKSLEFVRKTSKHTTGLRWAMSDRAKIVELVKKLSDLNDFLKELLNGHQIEMLNSRHIRTDYQIMQLNSRIDSLEEIVASCSVARSSTTFQQYFFNPPSYNSTMAQNSFSTLPQQPKQPHLVDLAQFKALSSAIDTNTLTEQVARKLDLGQTAKELTSGELAPGAISLIEADPGSSPNDQRVEAWYQRSKGVDQRVWVEWKECDLQFSDNGNNGPDPRVLRRLKALVALLRENKTTEQFKAPHCVGYFLQLAEEHRIGLVFENPPGVDQNARPVSLLELIQDSSRPMASLTARVGLARAIAECIERLHAVNWLHKGIRSNNILFFRGTQSDYDLSRPYLSGFDYSRPAQHEDMTEKPPENPAHDLYRHPQAHGNARDDTRSGGFKKQYDIYSLGVVLMEIFYWKPINVIVGIGDLRNVRPSETVKVRQKLLYDGFLEFLTSRLGDTIPVVIRACLEGPSAFGIPEGADDTDAFVGARLQGRFYDLVVKQLQGLKI